jgi:hypothetical protein
MCDLVYSSTSYPWEKLKALSVIWTVLAHIIHSWEWWSRSKERTIREETYIYRENKRTSMYPRNKRGPRCLTMYRFIPKYRHP